ncbi:hypothetical protein [Sedimenticola hydrogenitrophicus]|nr:hypothetical protein [Sedimenticola hydrogenitrophicus]
MTFTPKFTITNCTTQTITFIERERAVTPISSFAPSHLRVQNHREVE